MPKIQNTFVKGSMNKDVDPSLLTQDTYIHAENIRFNVNDGNDGIGNNIKGTLKVSDSTEGITDLKCISAYFDKNTDCIFYFLASDSGQVSKIVQYNVYTERTRDVIYDNKGILNFNKRQFITGVNEINGLLIFSEWGNNPRRINIERAKKYGKNGFTEEDIALMVKPPLQKMKITLKKSTTSSQDENNIEERMFAFSYRYRYLDGEYSSLAPFTNFAFAPKKFNYDFSTQSNKSMINSFNQVVLEFDTGSKLVSEIQLVFKQSDTLQGYIIDDFNKELLGWGNNEPKTFIFDNLKSIRGLPEDVLRNNYSRVPITSKSQTLIDGRLMLSNYLEDYDIKDSDGNEIELNYKLSISSETVSRTKPKPTVKSIRDYEAVIVYKDEWLRETTALSSKTNTIFIGSDLSNKSNSINVEIISKPPSWAKYYQFFIRQNGKDYDQILPTIFYEDGVYRWIKIESSDIDKIKEGDLLLLKSDTQDILSKAAKVRVLEIETKKRNFLENEETDSIAQIPGIYFKILQEDFRIYRDDINLYEFKAFVSNSGWNDVIGDNPDVVQSPVYYGDNGLDDLTSSGTYTGDQDKRYLVEIDVINIGSEGEIELKSGTSGSIDSITIDGTEILSAPVNFNTDLETTATDVAVNISAFSPTYFASSNGNKIKITNGDPSVINTNGFSVVSTTTGIDTVDKDMSIGNFNSFKWSKDNGANFIKSNVSIKPGTFQDLDEGVKVKFENKTGHIIGDKWYVGAKSSTGNYFGNNEDKRVFAIFKGPDQDYISSGAVITIIYDEYGDEKKYIEKTFISSSNYDNLEEWFIGDSIIDEIDISSDRIFFRKGVVKPHGGTVQLNITTDNTGTMNMIVRGYGYEGSNADKSAKVRTTLNITQLDNLIVFETEPKESLPEIFYEIGKTYKIENELHKADTINEPTDTDQTTSAPARIKLDWFNAWSFGNAVESYKIFDKFNQKGLDEGVRVTSRTKEKYKQVHRESDVTWSDVYNGDSNFNGLSAFKASLLNWITLDKENGSIQKLHNSNGNLMVLQEEGIGLIPYNKNIIYGTEGSNVVGISTNVLDKKSYRAYAHGKIGISKNPESFVPIGSRNYFTDKQRGNLIRLSIDGATEINMYGIEHEFSNLMIKNKTDSLVGGYDPKHKEYLLNLPSEDSCLLFIEGQNKGFPEYQTFNPDFMLGADNEFYSWKNGVMYIHNATQTRNNFYGEQKESKIKFVVNHSFGSDKIFNNIGVNSTHPWLAKLETPTTSREIPINSFVKQNEYWFSEIMGNTNEDTYYNSVFGLGSYEIVAGKITANYIPDGMCVGDIIISKDKNLSANEIIDITGNIISLKNNIDNVSTFLMYSKNQNIDGANIKGNFMIVELISDESEKVELRSVKTEAINNINT